MSVAHALWTTGPGQVELREELLPVIGAADVEIRTEFSAVSRGTEALVLAGAVPPSQHDTMRAPFQSGEFPFPVKYGYLSVGTVEQAGPRAQDLVGRRVFCLHPHQDRTSCPPRPCCPCPPPSRPAGRCWPGCWRPRSTASGTPVSASVTASASSVRVSSGCSSPRSPLARVPGTDVEAVDVRTDRAATAERLGFRLVAPDDARRERDVVLHTSGTGPGLTTGLQLLGDEGLLAEMSWYGDRSVEVGLGEGFHSRRLTIRASQVGRVRRRGRRGGRPAAASPWRWTCSATSGSTPCSTG